MKCGEGAEPAGGAAVATAAHWPTARCRRAAAEGPLSAERPASPAEIKLICAGKFVDNSVALSSEWHCHLLLLGSSPAAPPADRVAGRPLALSEPSPMRAYCQHMGLSAGLQHVFGDSGSDTVVTMHVVLRPPQAPKAAGGAAALVLLLPLRSPGSLGQLHVPCTAGTACAPPDGFRALPFLACSPQEAAAGGEQRLLRHLLSASGNSSSTPCMLGDWHALPRHIVVRHTRRQGRENHSPQARRCPCLPS
jgi:hypothetical protein